MKIPCDTIARLSHVVDRNHADPIFRTLRLDNGRVIATDRKFMAIERVEHFDGVFHIALSDALIEQCRTEAMYHSVLDLTCNAALKWTTGKTTMGWAVTENIGVWPTEPSAYDDWHERCVEPCATPATESKGAMIWLTDQIEAIARSSPSGALIFEQHIDVNRPALIRDIHSHDWVGIFMPRVIDGKFHAPADVPSWLK